MDTVIKLLKSKLSGCGPFWEGEHLSAAHRAFIKAHGADPLSAKAEDNIFYHVPEMLLKQELIVFRDKQNKNGFVVCMKLVNEEWQYARVDNDMRVCYTVATHPRGTLLTTLLVSVAIGMRVIADPDESEAAQLLEQMKRLPEAAWQEKSLLFMDSMYYDMLDRGYLELSASWSLIKDESLLSELKQAFRTGTLERVDLAMESAAQDVWPPAFLECKPEDEAEPEATRPDIKAEALAGKFDLGVKESSKRRTLEKYIPVPKFGRALRYAYRHLSAVKARMENGLAGIDAIGNDYVNLQFLGKPGTGKSMTGWVLGESLGLDVVMVSGSKNTEEDTYQGKNIIRNGQFDFTDQGFLEAFQRPCVILMEEYNLVDPGVLQGALGQALVPPFILHRDGYEDVHRHPLCVIVGTANPLTQGTKLQSPAFISRMPAAYVLDDPDEEDFVKILLQSGKPEKVCRSMYRAYSKVMNYVTGPQCRDEEAAKVLTLRQCITALDMLDDGVTFREALEDTIIGSLYAIDPELAAKARDNVVKLLPEAERRFNG